MRSANVVSLIAALALVLAALACESRDEDEGGADCYGYADHWCECYPDGDCDAILATCRSVGGHGYECVAWCQAVSNGCDWIECAESACGGS